MSDLIGSRLEKFRLNQQLRGNTINCFRLSEFPDIRLALVDGKVTSRENAIHLCITRYHIPTTPYMDAYLDESIKEVTNLIIQLYRGEWTSLFYDTRYFTDADYSYELLAKLCVEYNDIEMMALFLDSNERII